MCHGQFLRRHRDKCDDLFRTELDEGPPVAHVDFKNRRPGTILMRFFPSND